jgi:hypothetical protein
MLLYLTFLFPVPSSFALTISCSGGDGSWSDGIYTVAVESTVSFSSDNPSTTWKFEALDSGYQWSEVRPYNQSTRWTLSSGRATKTVYARFADVDHNWSEAVPDTIEFVGGPSTGDLDDDGEVNVVDIQFCVNVALGKEADSDIVQRAKEVAPSSDVCNVADVQRIVNVILDG